MVQEEKNPKKADNAESKTADEKKPVTVMIDTIPKEFLDKLSEKGIDADSIRLAVKSDMNSERVHCDNWLIVTDTDLIWIDIGQFRNIGGHMAVGGILSAI